MDGLYKDIKDALPERLNSRTKVQKVEQSLRTSLCALQDQQSDEKCLLLLKSGIIYLIKVMHLLNRSVPLKIDNNILNLILDSLVAASEHGSLSNSFVVSFSTDRCLDVILNDKFPFVSRIEGSPSLCEYFNMQESIKLGIREIVHRKSLFQLVLHVGDYEFQVCIVEFLFRLLPRKLRQKYSKNFIMDPETLGAFLAVKDSCFEVDCRKFLNQLNSSLAEDRRVCSFPCCKITLGPIELQKPCDTGYNDFWLDLNMGSKRMIIFCENAQLSSSQVSASDDCWDTVSVWHTDVHNIVCQEEQGQLHAEVHIKSTAACVPCCCEPGSHPVLHIIVDTKYNFEAVLGQVFGQKKVSDVATPIHCYTDNPSQEQNFAQELDDREEVDEVEEEDESVYPEKELMRAQDPPGSMRTGQGKMFKVSTPASTITVGSVCSTISSREKNRVASIIHTPQARTTRSKKKVKMPVVTLQEPVTKPTSANTRKTAKPKFVPPPALEMGNEKQAVDCQEEHKESPPSVVIPDSMPFPSQTNAEPPQVSNRKTRAKVCDSGISMNEKEKQHQLSTNSESSSTKSVKVQRSKSSERLLKSQEALAENPSRTLRSSQTKTSQKSSGAEHASPSQKSGRRRTASKSETIPSQNSVVEKKSCVNKNNIFTEPEDSQTVPSSLEEFKAPKSKKALTGATTKTVSSSSSSLKRNASGSQRSRKRLNARGETENSTFEEKLQRPGRGSQRTRQHADNVLQDCTNTLKSSSKQEQPSSGQQLTRPSSQLSCAKSTNHRGGSGRAGHPSDNTEDENAAECRFEVEPVTSPQSSPPGRKPQESTLEKSLTGKAGSSCHNSKARESRKDGAPERKTAGDSRMSVDNHPEIGDFSTSEQPKGTSLPADPEAESDKAPKQKGSFEREKCPKAVSGDKQNVTLCKSTEKFKMSAQGKSVGDKTINGTDTHEIHAVTVRLSHTDAQKTNSEQSHGRQGEMHMSDKTDTKGDHQQVSKCFNKENILSVRHSSSPSNNFESHEKHSDVSSDKRHKGQTLSNFESEDDDSINYRFEIETDTQLNAQLYEHECSDGKKVSSIQLDPSNQKQQIHDTETCREKTANQSGAHRAETSTEYESEDDDATYYQFELDTPRETPLKPSPLASASKEAQSQEQGTHGSKIQNRSRKPTFQSENEDFDDDQLAAQHDPGAEKQQYNTALKTSGKTKHLKYSFQENRSKPNHEKICSRQDAAKSIDLNAMPATAELRNEDDSSVPPSRNLRKRQPKSYKEPDESFENLEVDIQKKSQQKQAQSRSILSNKKYLFTKAELCDHQKSFVHKTFTMTISSTQEQTHTKSFHTDPYAFEEESTAHKSYKSATTSSKRCHAGQTRSRDQSKMMTPRSGAFSWDDDDNDADAEGSQESEMARVNEHSLASWRRSFSPIKFITPDPIFQRSDDCQDQTSPHRLFYSQKKKARPRVSHKPCSGGLPTSSAATDTTKQRWTKKASKTNHMPKNTSRSRKNGTPGAESLHDLSDAEAVTDTKSEVSWIAKHKAHVRLDPTKKKTYKRKPVNPTSPKNSPNRAFSWQKSPERSSELDSVSSSPEQPPVTMTPKHRSKKMYSPLDITVGSTPSVLCGAGDISDNFGRTSSKSKTSLKSALTHRTSLGGSSLSKRSFQSVISCSLASTKSLSATGGAPAPGSQESTSSEITRTRELEQLRIAAESSPSPLVSTSRFAQGKAVPVKLSNKSAKKLHKVNDEEEEEDEEDGEEMKLLKERGLVSGPSSIIRPRESVLKRTFGECSGFESEEEENSQSAKRLCLQPRELFPGCINSLPDSAGEKSKRKSQPSSKHSPKKPSKKTNSKTTSTALMEVTIAELSEEEVLPLEMPAPSVSTDELLSQPEMELGVEEPVAGVAALLKGFGFDLQKQMKEREHQVQEMAKGALKLTNKRVNHLWTTDRNKRGQVLNNFRDQINTDLSALEKDVAALNDIEKKAEVAYLQQIKVLHDHREKLLRRVRSVKECHEDFRLETEQIEGQSHESQRCLEAQMKKDLEHLKIKLLLDMQQQQLRRVKESLQKHFI